MAPPVGGVAAPASEPVASRGVVVVPFLTLTATDVLPVLPLASLTLAVSVFVPSPTEAVFHGIVTGPTLPVVVVPTVWVPTLRVYVFDVPVAPFSHSTAQLVP